MNNNKQVLEVPLKVSEDKALVEALKAFTISSEEVHKVVKDKVKTHLETSLRNSRKCLEVVANREEVAAEVNNK